jgi:hypothetical protein
MSKVLSARLEREEGRRGLEGTFRVELVALRLQATEVLCLVREHDLIAIDLTLEVT